MNERVNSEQLLARRGFEFRSSRGGRAAVGVLALVAALAAAPLVVAEVPAVFTVGPSGDATGQTDRASIQGAIDDAAAAGPGSIVQLAAGTYFTDGPLEMQSAPIALRGAGMGATVIQNAPGVLFGDLFYSTFIQVSLDTAWDSDEVCEFSISDLTIQAVGPTGHLYQGYDAWFDAIYIAGKPLGGEAGLSRFRAALQRIEVRGEMGDNYWFWSNVRMGLEILHDSYEEFLLSIDLEVSDCLFEDVAIAQDQWMLVDSNVRVERNTVRNTALAVMELGDASNSTIEVIGNDFEDTGRLIIWNGWSWGIPEVGDLPELSTWVIRDNRIRTLGVLSLDIRDLANFNVGIEGSDVTMAVEVTGNTLHAEGNDWPLAGAILALAVDDSLIAFNTVSGETLATEPQPRHVGIGNPIVITGDGNIVAFNDTSGFTLNPDSPYSVLLWDDARAYVNGVAEDNVILRNGAVLDETDGLNLLLDDVVNGGQVRALRSVLEAAVAASVRGSESAAANQLAAFANLVAALVRVDR